MSNLITCTIPMNQFSVMIQEGNVYDDDNRIGAKAVAYPRFDLNQFVLILRFKVVTMNAGHPEIDCGHAPSFSITFLDKDKQATGFMLESAYSECVLSQKSWKKIAAVKPAFARFRIRMEYSS